MIEHSITKLRQLLEAERTDPRLSRLLKKVNNKYQGTAEDLEALFNIAQRIRKHLIWRREPGDSDIKIYDVLEKPPEGVGWHDIFNLYKSGKPHQNEKIFDITEPGHTMSVHYLYTFREIVSDNDWHGFDVVDEFVIGLDDKTDDNTKEVLEEFEGTEIEEAFQYKKMENEEKKSKLLDKLLESK